MSSVEDLQQETTFQKLLTMVNAERTYHQNVIAILEKLHSEMVPDEETTDSSLGSEVPPRDDNVAIPNDGIVLDKSDIPPNDGNAPSPIDDNVPNRTNGQDNGNQSDFYFIAQVIHSFDAQSDGELSLKVDDYVVVRQVSSNGWSEGESKGEAGWFPSAYVEKVDAVIPRSKLSGETS